MLSGTSQQNYANSLFCNFLKGINSISRKEFWRLCSLYLGLVGYRTFASPCNLNKSQYFWNCKYQSLDQWLVWAFITHRFWNFVIQGNWQSAGTLKADSHIACRAHAVYLPCLAAKCLECVCPIWFTHYGRVWFTLTLPCPCRAHAMLWPCRSSQGQGTERPSRDGLWATCPLSASSGYHSEFHEGCYQKHNNLRCRWPVWNQTTFVMDE